MEFRRRQDELAARYKYIPRYELPLRVIETSKGVLVFSGGDIGWKGIDSFNKFLLGNYFSTHALPGPVRRYRVDSPSVRLYELTDISCRKEAGTNRYTFDLFDAYASVGASEKKGWVLEFSTDMEPSDTEYRRLEDFFGRRPEGNSKDICRLLTLQRHFDRDIILDPAFAYHFQFKEFVRRMDDWRKRPFHRGQHGKNTGRGTGKVGPYPENGFQGTGVRYFRPAKGEQARKGQKEQQP